MYNDDNVSFILLTGIMLLSLPVLTLFTDASHEKNFSSSSSLPLSSGIVVEKVEKNSEDSETLFLIDTDGNKDTIEKVMSVKNNTYDIQKGSQIQFKDEHPEQLELDISQVVFENLVSNQR